MSPPLVSCLMVTRNRARLALRAVHAFSRQTYANKELVIVDDGAEDYGPTIAPYVDRFPIRYLRYPDDPARTLGDARNMALEAAAGDYLMQWDDDEWYHPARIATQVAPLEAGAIASVLASTMWHLDTPEFRDHPFHRTLPRGTPGTIIHRRSSVRYPALRRGEDSVYLRELRAAGRVAVLRNRGHLFIRCFHGANTWGREHFLEQLHRKPLDRLHYVVATRLRKDLFTHPAFKLTRDEAAAFAQFRRDEAELFPTP